MCRICLHVCQSCSKLVTHRQDDTFFCSGHFWGTCRLSTFWLVKENLLCNPCLQQRLIDFVYGRLPPETTCTPLPDTEAFIDLANSVRPVSGDAYEVEADAAPTPAFSLPSDDDLDSLFSDIDPEDPYTSLEDLEHLLVLHSFVTNNNAFYQLQTGPTRMLMAERHVSS